MIKGTDPGEVYLKSRNAFHEFLKTNADNPKYKDRYVAFVYDKLEGVDKSKAALSYRMDEKFGNVDRYIDKVTNKMRTG